MSRAVTDVRLARPDDVDTIGDTHVAGWRVGYRGIFPDAVPRLGSLSPTGQRIGRLRG